MKPSEFLQKLWGPEPAGKYYLWTHLDRITHWYTGYETVDRDFARQNGRNIYYGLAMIARNTVPDPKKPRHKQRPSNDTPLLAIPGLWADIDWQDRSHKKTNLPPDENAALELLDSLEYRPTIIVNSGNGLHVLWLFQRPWLFAGDADQRSAARAVHWWQERIRRACRERGWELDSTHSLTQMLRLPGFDNLKSEPKPVTVIAADGPRLDQREIARRSFEESQPEPATTPQSTGRPAAPRPAGNPQDYGFTLHADAQPPEDKLRRALRSEKFAATWNHQRQDLVRDNSPSAYDLSLANAAIRRNWTPQETVDLMVAFRRRHALQPKLRYGYYHRTLARAGQSIVEDAASDLLEAVNLPNGPETEAGRQQMQELIRNGLSKVWRLELLSITECAGQPESTFWVSTTAGNGIIGTIRDLRDQPTFQRRMKAITEAYPPPAKRQYEWQNRVRAMLHIRKVLDCRRNRHPDDATQRIVRELLGNERASENGAGMNGTGIKDAIMETLIARTGRAASGLEIAQRLRQEGARPQEEPDEERPGGRAKTLAWKMPPGGAPAPNQGEKNIETQSRSPHNHRTARDRQDHLAVGPSRTSP